MNLRLRPLRPEDESEALAAHAELREQDGFGFLLDWNPAGGWAVYLQQLAQWRRGLELPPDRVPASFLVADLDGTIAGRISIRHELNAFLAIEGGHIGYAVRPRLRRRGVATEILRQGLIVAYAQGIAPVLITCDEFNLASATIIERAGGVLEDVRDGSDGVPKRRYWIS